MTPLQLELHTERKARLARMSPRPRQISPAPQPAANRSPPVKPWFRMLPDHTPWFVLLGEGMVPPTPKKRPESSVGLRVGSIQMAVAEHFDIGLTDLNSDRRTANVVKPRQIVMYLSRRLTRNSLPEIGRRCGGRDHTTVMHAINVCARILERDQEYADDIRELFAKLEPYAPDRPRMCEAS